MSTFLFDDFERITPNAWKQKIQVDLKGADYNETLLWKTEEGLSIKPFYTREDRTNQLINLPKSNFKICQTITISNEKQANTIALKAIKNGVNAIQFIAKTPFSFIDLLKNINLNSLYIYFKFQFLDEVFIIEISKFVKTKNCYFQIDIIGNLAETGNWFKNLSSDYKIIEQIASSVNNSISVSGDLYQNAGANIIQQLAYILAHANEYLNHFGEKITSKIHFQFSVGSNYFHEIAKLRAFRLLWSSLLENYNFKDKEAHLFIQPSFRNKTLYDFNVNMLRTTSECMSAILGGANTISNLSYDCVFANSNEFGDRIAKNQLLILQQESGFKNAQKFSDGAYYIEALTNQFAEKALHVFKQIEKGGGFLKQLKQGIIQRKIKETSKKEENLFNTKELILLGSNLQPNKNDSMKKNIEDLSFIKKRNQKTLIQPIIRKRIAEAYELKRLKKEI